MWWHISGEKKSHDNCQSFVYLPHEIPRQSVEKKQDY